MAIKKSELYSSLWQSCDELRGGMDASQYKDYVLVLLFIKYVSDKYAGQRYGAITIPKGASFADMVALKGSKDIGDSINKRIIAPLEQTNGLSFGGIDFKGHEILRNDIRIGLSDAECRENTCDGLREPSCIDLHKVGQCACSIRHQRASSSLVYQDGRIG